MTQIQGPHSEAVGLEWASSQMRRAEEGRPTSEASLLRSTHGTSGASRPLRETSDGAYDADVTTIPTPELRARAQGCTEFTCLYHGAVNRELRFRAGRR